MKPNLLYVKLVMKVQNVCVIICVGTILVCVGQELEEIMINSCQVIVITTSDT
jgi:hypothetical protein